MQTQKLVVEGFLKKTGRVSRNQCLRLYISRLGAIINRLKHEGYKFETKRIKTKKSKYGDFVYIKI